MDDADGVVVAEPVADPDIDAETVDVPVTVPVDDGEAPRESVDVGDGVGDAMTPSHVFEGQSVQPPAASTAQQFRYAVLLTFALLEGRQRPSP